MLARLYKSLLVFIFRLQLLLASDVTNVTDDEKTAILPFKLCPLNVYLNENIAIVHRLRRIF